MSSAMACRAASLRICGAGRSGKPCARFTALCFSASRVISRITLSVMPRVRSARKVFLVACTSLIIQPRWQRLRARMMAGGAHLSLVTNLQLYLAIGVPMLFNAVLIGLVVKLLMAHTDGKFAAMEARFDAIDRRFDDMRDLWRAKLRRVEEVLDAH